LLQDMRDLSLAGVASHMMQGSHRAARADRAR
jgi:hypothetical protein